MTLKKTFACPHCRKSVEITLQQDEIGKDKKLSCPYDECRRQIVVLTAIGKGGKTIISVASGGLEDNVEVLKRQLNLFLAGALLHNSPLHELFAKFRRAGYDVVIDLGVELVHNAPAREPVPLVQGGKVVEGAFSSSDAAFLKLGRISLQDNDGQ